MRSDGGWGGVATYGRVHGWYSAGNVKIDFQGCRCSRL